MILVFFILAALYLTFYFPARKKFAGTLEKVDGKQYPLKRVMPLALFILDKTGYRYNTRYDKGLKMKIVQISSPQLVGFHLVIHWANRVSLLLVTLLLLSLIGAGMEPDGTYGVFCLLILSGVVYFSDRELNERIRKRRERLGLEFPEFLNKLTLLINAGMTLSRAWGKIVQDGKKKTPLQEELELVLLDIQSGKSEIQAYEDFAKRCRLPEITRFASVIIQNLRKGNGDVVSILRLLANDCWENRKNMAKRMGEEASTKMLLPMMIMFLAVLIIVVLPAVLAMQGI